MSKKLMNRKEANEVLGKLDWEGGYDYFLGGSSFPEIEDKHFHRLREAFVLAADKLTEYLGEMDEEGNEI